MSKDIVYCNNHLFCGDTDCENNPCHITDEHSNHRFAKYPECKREYREGHVEKITDKEETNETGN